jgi:magnesium chelatase family protein
MLEVSIIASITGTLKDAPGLIRNRPYRDPHSSSSMAAMVGGGRNAKPGEITMAHLGVLFLDELPEFSRVVLESLRQPIEQGTVTIARVNNHITYPSRFQLIAAMNPCKCGYFGETRACGKVPRCAEDYQGRISGPLLDRFDLMVDVTPVNFEIFANDNQLSESSMTIRERVLQARLIQLKRYKHAGISLNTHAYGDDLIEFGKLCNGSVEILKKAMDRFSLSMRALSRVLRVARTIADLANVEEIVESHIIEALSFRNVKLKV